MTSKTATAQTEPVTVVIVDDQSLVRDSVRGLIETRPEFQVIGEAADGVQACALVRSMTPDLVLMDLRMPILDGIGATRSIRATGSNVPILALTTFAEDELVREALAAGVSGYVTKDVDSDALFAAIDVVRSGGLAVSARAVSGLSTSPDQASQTRDSFNVSRNPHNLTERELEVLGLIAAGLDNHEIAAALFVGSATIKTHINHIFAKTGILHRAAAVAYAHAHNLIA